MFTTPIRLITRKCRWMCITTHSSRLVLFRDASNLTQRKSSTLREQWGTEATFTILYSRGLLNQSLRQYRSYPCSTYDACWWDRVYQDRVYPKTTKSSKVTDITSSFGVLDFSLSIPAMRTEDSSNIHISLVIEYAWTESQWIDRIYIDIR